MGDTAWLDELEMRIWRGFLEAAGHVTARVDSALKDQVGLTLDDYEVLVHLSEADPQRLRMTDLSDRLLHSQSRVSQRVDRLVRRGLVTREKCADDGRVTFACLSANGMKLVREVAPDHLVAVRSALVDLVAPEERRAFAHILETVAAAGRADGIE